jgi:hypothetical protein
MAETNAHTGAVSEEPADNAQAQKVPFPYRRYFSEDVRTMGPPSRQDPHCHIKSADHDHNHPCATLDVARSYSQDSDPAAMIARSVSMQSPSAGRAYAAPNSHSRSPGSFAFRPQCQDYAASQRYLGEPPPGATPMAVHQAPERNHHYFGQEGHVHDGMNNRSSALAAYHQTGTAAAGADSALVTFPLSPSTYSPHDGRHSHQYIHRSSGHSHPAVASYGSDVNAASATPASSPYRMAYTSESEQQHYYSPSRQHLYDATRARRASGTAGIPSRRYFPSHTCVNTTRTGMGIPAATHASSPSRVEYAISPGSLSLSQSPPLRATVHRPDPLVSYWTDHEAPQGQGSSRTGVGAAPRAGLLLSPRRMSMGPGNRSFEENPPAVAGGYQYAGGGTGSYGRGHG